MMKIWRQKISAQNADMNGSDMRPTVVSIFAGSGGSTLGYEWAGFNELLAIDYDSSAVNVFRLNFPNIPVWQKDIKDVAVESIMRFCKIQRGELDVLDGSPPCQGFSTAGKRMVGDLRNDLFLEFVRLIEGLEPKVFLMENVSGMIKGKMRGRFVEIMKRLKSLDYFVKCRLMNARYYGVPQSRERLIWVGVNKKFSINPSYPSPRGRYVTVRDALRQCPRGVYYKPSIGGKLEKYVKMIGQGETGAKYHPTGNFFNLRRLRWDKPSYTICKHGGRNMIHPQEDRFISDTEAKRLCSFPDKFVLVGSAVRRIELLGNAVMPRFMEAIAKHIKDEILAGIKK